MAVSVVDVPVRVVYDDLPGGAPRIVWLAVLIFIPFGHVRVAKIFARRRLEVFADLSHDRFDDEAAIVAHPAGTQRHRLRDQFAVLKTAPLLTK